MSAVCEAFEEGCGLADEIFTFFDGFFDLDDVAGGWGRNGERFGGVYHEYCEFELEVRVLGFPGICSVELEGAFVGEEGCLISWTEMGVVEDGARRW